MYFIARFLYLLKIKNARIRFKLINKKLFDIFGDLASSFKYFENKNSLKN